MNFRKNNGFTGIDISIAMLIILIFIPTIFGIVYNIQKNNSFIKRESYAINIATYILETAKFCGYSGCSVDNNSNFMSAMKSNYQQSNYVNNDKHKLNYQYVAFSTKDSNDIPYQIQIGVIEGTMENKSLAKIIHVIVYYPVGDKEKSIEISTAIPNS